MTNKILELAKFLYTEEEAKMLNEVIRDYPDVAKMCPEDMKMKDWVDIPEEGKEHYILYAKSILTFLEGVK